MMSSGSRRNISATAARLTMSLSRTRRYFSGSSNMMSIVSQNGPAFFDRTSTARSAIVAPPFVVASMSDLLEFGAEQAGRAVRHEDMVQVELVDRAAVEFGRRVREGDAGNQPVPFRDRVVHREM